MSTLLRPISARVSSRGAWWRRRWRYAWHVAWRRAPTRHAASQTSDQSSHAAHAQRAQAAPAPLSDECERFIRQHERQILNYLWRITGDEQSAYDLTQEVFLRAWQRFATISQYEQPRAWLFRVATNLALSYLRRHSIPTISATPLDTSHDPAASDPARRVAETDQVRRVLLQLTPQRRAALVLREVYGLSCAEVASTLAISGPAVRMALHRAREQFRDLYTRAEGGR